MFEAVVLWRDQIGGEAVTEVVAVAVVIDDAANDSRCRRDDGGAIAAAEVDAVGHVGMVVVIIVRGHHRVINVRNAVDAGGRREHVVGSQRRDRSAENDEAQETQACCNTPACCFGVGLEQRKPRAWRVFIRTPPTGKVRSLHRALRTTIPRWR